MFYMKVHLLFALIEVEKRSPVMAIKVIRISHVKDNYEDDPILYLCQI